jgi:rubrerythrin
MDICLNCKKAIMEPGVPYLYAGPVCHCPVNSAKQFQRPSREENFGQNSNSTLLEMEDRHDIDLATRMVIGDLHDKLKTALAERDEAKRLQKVYEDTAEDFGEQLVDLKTQLAETKREASERARVWHLQADLDEKRLTQANEEIERLKFQLSQNQEEIELLKMRKCGFCISMEEAEKIQALGSEGKP